MRQLNDQNFSTEIGGSSVALVMFSAPWAGPCNLARPTFEAVAGRYGNQMSFGEFNLDDNPETPWAIGVKQIPLFVLFEKGKPTVMKAGAVPEEVLVDLCEKVLE
jgi:thioredoxin 1